MCIRCIYKICSKNIQKLDFERCLQIGSRICSNIIYIIIILNINSKVKNTFKKQYAGFCFERFERFFLQIGKDSKIHSKSISDFERNICVFNSVNAKYDNDFLVISPCDIVSINRE